jgi:hypothetical protein
VTTMVVPSHAAARFLERPICDCYNATCRVMRQGRPVRTNQPPRCSRPRIGVVEAEHSTALFDHITAVLRSVRLACEARDAAMAPAGPACAMEQPAATVAQGRLASARSVPAVRSEALTPLHAVAEWDRGSAGPNQASRTRPGFTLLSWRDRSRGPTPTDGGR